MKTTDFTLIFVFLISLSYTSAQKELNDFYLKKTITENDEKITFEVLDSDKHGVWFHSKEKYYFWYKAQKMISTQGGSSGQVLNGSFNQFHSNKQLKAQGRFFRGLKHGEWKQWRSDGTLLKTGRWVRGRIKEQLHYDFDGKVSETLRYKPNAIYRETKDSIIVYKHNGQRETITIRNEAGKVVQIEERKEGKLHGQVRHYTDDELVRIEKYKDGELVSKNEVNKNKSEEKNKEKE